METVMRPTSASSISMNQVTEPPKTTIYSRDEFEVVFNEIDSDIREAIFIRGEHKPLIELVERSHGVSFRDMTD
jgi:hypothetical protein